MGTSLFKFEGKVGDMVYYYLNGKPVKRSIGKVDIERMRTAPQYEETRKNQSELAMASRGGKLFREGLQPFTKGHTMYSYASDVVSILLRTLRSDMTRPKGQKQIRNGLKNVASQLAFSKLNIFSKRETAIYKNTLLRKINGGNSWRLNRNILFGKGVQGDQMSVRIGYYHVDFEGGVSKYEHAVSIACHRDEKIEFSDFKLPKYNENKSMPCTFIILQVWREGHFQDITGMTYMSVLDVVDNDALSDALEEKNEPLLHKCGRELDEMLVLYGSQRGKVGANLAHAKGLSSGLHISEEMIHGPSRFRDDMVRLGGQHDWGEVIGKVLKE
jgi:hypothetical protein